MGDAAFLGRPWLAGPPGASLRLIRDCGGTATRKAEEDGNNLDFFA